MKNKILSLILILIMIASIGLNIHLINNKRKDYTQEKLNNDISSQLFFLGGSLEEMRPDDKLRFMSSITGSIFWLSRSSNTIDRDTVDLFMYVNNVFISESTQDIYINRVKLSQLFKTLANNPNDKKANLELKNWVEPLLFNHNSKKK